MGMILTRKNVETAIEISRIIAEKECTIADLPGIFSYVEMKLRKKTIVPKADYAELFKSELEGCDD